LDKAHRRDSEVSAVFLAILCGSFAGQGRKREFTEPVHSLNDMSRSSIYEFCPHQIERQSQL
jgi:hypothetical protein